MSYVPGLVDIIFMYVGDSVQCVAVLMSALFFLMNYFG